MATEGWRLKDGDRIAIVGGGPAGSLFAYFALQAARVAGVRPEITIYDGKVLSATDAAGCNQSAGVVAHDFAADLHAAGLDLPEAVVQRHIHAYRLVTLAGAVRIEQPGTAEATLAVYRGGGPRGSERRGYVGLDEYLLQQVGCQGVRIIPHYVSQIEPAKTTGRPARVKWVEGEHAHYDDAQLVVVAVGVNGRLLRTLSGSGLGYVPPQTLSSIQVEIRLSRERVDEAFGDAISVYTLPIPGVRFAAVTPKYDYVTVTVVGHNVGAGHLTQLLSWPDLRERLEGALDHGRFACECKPRVVVSAAVHPYADRVVVVGDAAASRLFKNGLESALTTARAAAAAAITQGVSATAFAQAYAPVCRAIADDNRWGAFLFRLYDYSLLEHPNLTRRLVRAIRYEQQCLPAGRRPLCGLLWEILNGTTPYRRIVPHVARPGIYEHLLRGKAAVT